MTAFVPRTCTEIGEDGQVRKNPDGSERTCLSLEEFWGTDAYVLLGAPGAGKTTVFKQEAACCSKACHVTARDFITFDDRPEWHNTTLFIDGLDERRAGSPDGRTPLDEIRGKLEQLDRPGFRLSCREADWFGANDRESLKAVSRNGQVTVLRLDPLTDEDVHKILRDNLKVDDPERFINKAHEQMLETLLANPQSLLMLANSVAGAGGDWPEARMQTFDMACRTLLREHSQGHQVAKPHSVAISGLLDVAGRLCAVQLLTGVAGYTLPGTESDRECPGLEQISGEDQEILRYVLSTKLFETPSEGRRTPVHRHVAEFLGGRYLASLIEKGLPVGRILALMTVDGGGVVSELRGLSAWLATHSTKSRMEIIEHDPIGIVLYGDVRDFSVDEKRSLINGLSRESQRNPWFFGSLEMMDSRFGELATPDMESAFRKVLTSPTRDDTHQGLVVVLVEALRHGPAIPKLTDVLLGIFRDDNWWPRIRHRALDTVIHKGRNDKQTDAALMAFLADVNDGSVPDPEDELLGRLLNGLYPSRLSAAEILQCLRTPKNKNLSGVYRLFWYDMAINSTNAQRAELLDILVERHHELWKKIQVDPGPGNPACRLPSLLLARFLNTLREDITPDRLFDWLGVAALDFEDFDPSGLYEPTGTAPHDIGVWLSEHPKIQKTIIAMCVEHCRGGQQFDSCVYMKRRRLFGATPPSDFGFWCLEQAIRATDDNAAIWYIIQAAGALYNHQHDEGLTREIVDERLATHPSLEKAFMERLSEREECNATENTFREEHEKQKKKELKKFREYVKEHVEALSENRCPPSLLHQLAGAYFGELTNVAVKNPKERLYNLLGDDTGLIEMVLVGLRGSISRNDVPTDAEIIRLSAGNRRHFLELPFLAGLEELSEPEREPPLNERQMRQCIAFYYNSGALPYYRGEKPHWYRWLLARRPDVVSDVLIKFVRSQLRSGKERFAEARELASSKEHQVVARLASLALLELFPVRCTSAQLGLLNVLLRAALIYCEKEAFEKLIEHKLSLQSMNVAQRVYWLVAGFFASPASYRERLKTSVSGHEQRIRHLAQFLTTPPAALLGHLNVQDLKLLIQLTGGSYRPYSDYSPSREFSTDSARWNTSALVTGLINRLASLPSRDATRALESLQSDNALYPWRYRLIDAAYQQNITRREANFRHKDVDQVLQVLDNLKPANAADLAALTMDILADMAKRIRDGNTSDWRQYWTPSKKPVTPEHEDFCRDALLSDLRLKLAPLGIDAQPEGHYADNKRSDIRVSYCDFNVPVEIKKNKHPDLWSAIKTQLITKYTRDPGADGYGIYLVFWFGTEGCQMPPSGKRPTSAHELRERLLDTLSADEKFKISICVIDVSKPL